MSYDLVYIYRVIPNEILQYKEIINYIDCTRAISWSKLYISYNELWNDRAIALISIEMAMLW